MKRDLWPKSPSIFDFLPTFTQNFFFQTSNTRNMGKFSGCLENAEGGSQASNNFMLHPSLEVDEKHPSSLSFLVEIYIRTLSDFIKLIYLHSWVSPIDLLRRRIFRGLGIGIMDACETFLFLWLLVFRIELHYTCILYKCGNSRYKSHQSLGIFNL